MYYMKRGEGMYKIVIPYLQIGNFRVETPKGLSELLEPAWSKPKKNDETEKFLAQYERTVFRNSEGQIVTRYIKAGEQT